MCLLVEQGSIIGALCISDFLNHVSRVMFLRQIAPSKGWSPLPNLLPSLIPSCQTSCQTQTFHKNYSFATYIGHQLTFFVLCSQPHVCQRDSAVWEGYKSGAMSRNAYASASRDTHSTPAPAGRVSGPTPRIGGGTRSAARRPGDNGHSTANPGVTARTRETVQAIRPSRQHDGRADLWDRDFFFNLLRTALKGGTLARRASFGTRAPPVAL